MTSRLTMKLNEYMNNKFFYSQKTNEMLNYITLDLKNEELAEESQLITH